MPWLQIILPKSFFHKKTLPAHLCTQNRRIYTPASKSVWNLSLISSKQSIILYILQSKSVCLFGKSEGSSFTPSPSPPIIWLDSKGSDRITEKLDPWQNPPWHNPPWQNPPGKKFPVTKSPNLYKSQELGMTIFATHRILGIYWQRTQPKYSCARNLI